MTKITKIIFLLIVFSSCKNEKEKPIIEVLKVKKELIKIDSTKQLLTLKRKFGYPIYEFQTFTKDIEEDKWFSDTVRLKRVNIYSSLKKANIKLFNNRPFYRISFNDSEIKKSLRLHIYNGKYADSLDVNLVMRVKTIWGYFYRGEKKQNTIEDGLIEQWEYESEYLAKEALKEIEEFGRIAYFNTNPYFIRVENYVFIFHTRAMSFSYGQKEIYKKFKNHVLKNAKLTE